MMLLKYLIILQIQHENEKENGKENGTGVTNKNMDEEKREKLQINNSISIMNWEIAAKWG